MYTDNQYKFIAVLNPKIEVPKLMNALGHMTAGLIAKANDADEMQFLKYEFQANWATSSLISLYPFILLTAKNNSQLKSLHQAVSAGAILHNVFTETMLGVSAAEQIDSTKNTNSDELTYLGILLFGSTDQLTTLTRKFSLFKS